MEQEAVMSGKYVRVDDVMKLINTSNRGTCDYFIVDQIEELCRSEKIYDLDWVVEQIEKLKKAEQDRPDDCDENGFGDGEQIFNDGRSQGRFEAFGEAIKIVKGGGV